MTAAVIALLPVGIWTYLLLGRGGFWRVSKHLSRKTPASHVERAIVAVIPARDEADVIGQAVGSLLQQQLSPPLRVIVVDDHSSDGTATAASEAASQLHASDRLQIIRGQSLPIDWTGKLWALQQGVEAALLTHPNYLLLTDADIRHDEWSIATLLEIAETTGSDLASFMVKLATDTAAERLLIPAFVYFFFALYPPAWTGSRSRNTAGAAGGCVLIKPSALQLAGGLPAIRGKVIDDCALANAVKQGGGRAWLGLTEQSRSLRSYGGFGGVAQMIARSAFYQLNHSYPLLVLTVVALGATYLLPLYLMTRRRALPVAGGAISYALMTVSYLPMVGFYRQSVIRALTLPLAALFYAGATLFSAWRFARGRGGQWKGRVQDYGRGSAKKYG